VLLDDQRDPVSFDTRDFAAFQHAYAISIHKSQGATVESCRYLFSEFVSSELAYVGMSRHRDTFGLYCRADQEAGLAGWMGKRIEKLDARDLVSADELNTAADRLRGQDAVRASAARRHVLASLSKIVRRLVKHAKTDLVERLPAIPTAALDSLRVYRQTLAGHLARLRRLGHPAVNSAVVPSIASHEATTTPHPTLIEKLHQRRQQSRQEGGTAPHIP
jgi:hypothetical protein